MQSKSPFRCHNRKKDVHWFFTTLLYVDYVTSYFEIQLLQSQRLSITPNCDSLTTQPKEYCKYHLPFIYCWILCEYSTKNANGIM